MQGQLASEALRAGAEEQHGIDPKGLTLTLEDLGLRTTYFASGPITKETAPDDYCDFAVPFA